MNLSKWKGEFKNFAITLMLPTPIPTSGSHEVDIKIKVGALPKIPMKTRINFSTRDSDGITMHVCYNGKDIVLWCDYVSHNKIEGEYLNDFLNDKGNFRLERKID